MTNAAFSAADPQDTKGKEKQLLWSYGGKVSASEKISPPGFLGSKNIKTTDNEMFFYNVLKSQILRNNDDPAIKSSIF